MADTASARASLQSHVSLAAGAGVLLLLVVLSLFLQTPSHPTDLTIDHFLRLPLEAPLLLLSVMLIRAGMPGRLLRVSVVLVIVLFMALQLLDLGSEFVFGRRFNPIVEFGLFDQGWDFVSRSLGRWQALGMASLVTLALVLLAALLVKALADLAAFAGGARRIALLLCAVLASLVFVTGTSGIGRARVSTELGENMLKRLRYLQHTLVDQSHFGEQLAIDTLAHRAPRFGALQGRDVLVIFVESYGRSYLERERFATRAASAHQRLGSTLASAGLHVASGWLGSPVRGGRSWLAHASFMSGLELSNQARYDRMVTTDRTSLTRLFGAAGWQTAGVFPAVRDTWPKGDWWGFDTLLGAPELAYQGQGFGWITMPDQYVLSHFEQAIRQAAETPVMAEFALISSHAPWTPLPKVIDWEQVGDGSIYDGSRREGEPMDWSDPERVRSQYAASLDYSLDVLGQYLARHADDALVLILGDHQPMSIVAGWDRTADVPVHVISADADLLKRLPGRHFRSGLNAGSQTPSLPMADMRELLATRFESLPNQGLVQQ